MSILILTWLYYITNIIYVSTSIISKFILVYLVCKTKRGDGIAANYLVLKST